MNTLYIELTSSEQILTSINDVPFGGSVTDFCADSENNGSIAQDEGYYPDLSIIWEGDVPVVIIDGGEVDVFLNPRPRRPIM